MSAAEHHDLLVDLGDELLPAGRYLLRIGNDGTELTNDALAVAHEVTYPYVAEHYHDDTCPEAAVHEVEAFILDIASRFAGIALPVGHAYSYPSLEFERCAVAVVEQFAHTDPLALRLMEAHRHNTSIILYRQWRAGR